MPVVRVGQPIATHVQRAPELLGVVQLLTPDEEIEQELHLVPEEQWGGVLVSGQAFHRDRL